jgi:two-component system, cell cycle sensor histidine kinase and response regulator CckA
MDQPPFSRGLDRLAWTGGLLFCALLAAGGWLVGHSLQRDALVGVHAQLTAIGQLKTRQIAIWREGRKAAVGVVARWVWSAGPFSAFLDHPDRPGARDAASAFLHEARQLSGFAEVLIVAPNGELVLTTDASDNRLDSASSAAVRQAAAGSVAFSALYRCSVCGRLHLDVTAPVRSPDGRVAAVLVGRIDPRQTLFPMVTAWPATSETGESLLFERTSGMLRHISPPRFLPDLPLPSRMLPPTQPAQSRVGPAYEGGDYRGSAVIADTRPVLGTSWYLITQVHADEAMSTARAHSAGLAASVGLSMVLVASAVWSLNRRRQRDSYRRLYEIERSYHSRLRHFEHVLRYSNDALLLSDDGGRILEVNERATEMYGWSADEFRQRRVSDLHADDEARRPAPAADAALDGGVFESWHRRADESRFPVEVSARRLEIEGRSFYHEFVRDITERKRVETLIQESETRYRTLVEHATDAIYLEFRSAFTYLNPAALTLLGAASESDLVGTPILDRIHPAQRALVAERIHRVNVLRQVGPAIEVDYLRLDGRTVSVEATSAPIRLAGDDGAVVFLRDVSERKRLEESLRQAQRMEAIGRLAGAVAHDFGNLLTVINGYAEVCARVPPPATLNRDLGQIRTAGRSAERLTRQLLAFSRGQVLQAVTLNLNDSVRGFRRMLTRVVGADVQVVTRLDAALPNVVADPGQIEQVLMNLVVNARDAMPSGGRLRIETAAADLDEHSVEHQEGARRGRHALLSVSDNGCGMDSETRKQIFDPFFTTKPVGQGTGLGLSTVYGIVKQSRGAIWVFSQPGHGTTVRIYLPATDAPIEQVPDRASPACTGGNERILLVEDDKPVRELAARLLEETGYTVVAAPHARAALAAARRVAISFDLLLTDVVLPGMGGTELARRLKGQLPALKVLFMSGYAQRSIVDQRMLRRGTHFIGKPFTADGLREKVREVLDSTG